MNKFLNKILVIKKMFKLNTYYEKDKLPTIYSSKLFPKSFSQKRKINYQNIFDQTFSKSIYDLNKNNYDRIKIISKDIDFKNKLNPFHNKNSTIYNKNTIKNKNNKDYDNHRTKSYNNQTQIRNNIVKEVNIAFNESYNNFINNIKTNKYKFKDISKDIDNNKLQPLKNKYSPKIKTPFILQNHTLISNNKNKHLNNNIKIISKKKEDSFGERLKKFFMPSTTNTSNKRNILNETNIENNNKKKCSLCQKYIDIYRFNTHFNLHPSKIFNWLYLGSYQNACNLKDLKDLKINYILNCAAECQNKNYPDIDYYQVKINDFPNFNISLFFKKTNEFINKAKLLGKNILIHCQLGISRSTTCLIAYMIKYMGYTTISALQFIKNKRPHIMPNFGFLQQLKNYEEKIKLEKDDKNELIDNNSNKKLIKKELKLNEFLMKFSV